MPEPQSFDCVVIGAGNGGLSAAAQLAAKGVKTLLLEQHNLPGGFATSFVRGRFEFEAALHEFADVGSPTDKGGVRAYLEDELGYIHPCSSYPLSDLEIEVPRAI